MQLANARGEGEEEPTALVDLYRKPW